MLFLSRGVNEFFPSFQTAEKRCLAPFQCQFRGSVFVVAGSKWENVLAARLFYLYTTVYNIQLYFFSFTGFWGVETSEGYPSGHLEYKESTNLHVKLL